MFWTPSAQTAAGGLTQIQNNIDTAITLTNTAYRNSGIAQRVRLVSKQAVNYSEARPTRSATRSTRITAAARPPSVHPAPPSRRNATFTVPTKSCW